MAQGFYKDHEVSLATGDYPLSPDRQSITVMTGPTKITEHFIDSIALVAHRQFFNGWSSTVRLQGNFSSGKISFGHASLFFSSVIDLISQAGLTNSSKAETTDSSLDYPVDDGMSHGIALSPSSELHQLPAV